MAWEQASLRKFTAWRRYGESTTLELLKLHDASAAVQDDIGFASFVVAQAAFTFLREPEPIDKDRVYWNKHPPQPVRLQVMSRFVLKFAGEFRPDVRATLTQPRYKCLMDAVSSLMWSRHEPRLAVSSARLHCFGVTTLTEVRNCRNFE